jgi:carbon starvation protein
MSAIGVLLISVLSIIAGYWLYARSIDRSVIRPDEKKATPAKMYMDGVDFTPANRNVLFGYQFKSIAALGPILGPIVAVQWGWLPALAWIIFGTMFIGWVQDYSSIVLGVREEGQSFGALSYRLISPRSRGILITFIYFYLWLIMGSLHAVGFNLFEPGSAVGVSSYRSRHARRPDDLQVEASSYPTVTLVLAFHQLMGTWDRSEPDRAISDAGANSPVLFLQVTVGWRLC